MRSSSSRGSKRRNRPEGNMTRMRIPTRKMLSMMMSSRERKAYLATMWATPSKTNQTPSRKYKKLFVVSRKSLTLQTSRNSSSKNKTKNSSKLTFPKDTLANSKSTRKAPRKPLSSYARLLKPKTSITKPSGSITK